MWSCLLSVLGCVVALTYVVFDYSHCMCAQTKLHFNSFTTDFFVPMEAVEAHLSETADHPTHAASCNSCESSSSNGNVFSGSTNQCNGQEERVGKYGGFAAFHRKDVGYFDSCLKLALRCHRCGVPAKSLPQLKNHLLSCIHTC